MLMLGKYKLISVNICFEGVFVKILFAKCLFTSWSCFLNDFYLIYEPQYTCILLDEIFIGCSEACSCTNIAKRCTVLCGAKEQRKLAQIEFLRQCFSRLYRERFRFKLLCL